MKKKGVVLGQDKNYAKNLPLKEVKEVIACFKQQYIDREDHPNREIIGFELNGGKGLTPKGREIWEKFQEWCDTRSLEAEYNSESDVTTIRDKLRYKIDNKNTY